MRRQEQLAGEQREQQHGRDDGGNLLRIVTPGALEEHHRNESDDRRERTKGHRRGHFPGALDHRLERRQRARPQLVVDVLARNDGIVANDADDDEESEQAHHVGRDPQPRHHQQAAGERDRNAGGNPERQLRPHGESEQHQHQQTALQRVRSEGTQPRPDRDRLIVPDGELDALRETGGGGAHVFADLVRDVDGALVAGAHHLHEEGRPAVELHPLVTLLKAIVNRRHVAEEHFRPVGGPDGNLRELRLGIGLSAGPNDEGAALAIDGAGGQIDREAPDGVGEILKRELVGQQTVGARLDGDLNASTALHLGAADARYFEQILLHAPGDLAQIMGTNLAGNRHIQDGEIVAGLRNENPGPFGLVGKRRDRVNPCLHIVH